MKHPLMRYPKEKHGNTEYTVSERNLTCLPNCVFLTPPKNVDTLCARRQSWLAWIVACQTAIQANERFFFFRKQPIQKPDPPTLISQISYQADQKLAHIKMAHRNLIATVSKETCSCNTRIKLTPLIEFAYFTKQHNGELVKASGISKQSGHYEVEGARGKGGVFSRKQNNTVLINVISQTYLDRKIGVGGISAKFIQSLQCILHSMLLWS